MSVYPYSHRHVRRDQEKATLKHNAYNEIDLGNSGAIDDKKTWFDVYGEQQCVSKHFHVKSIEEVAMSLVVFPQSRVLLHSLTKLIGRKLISI